MDHSGNCRIEVMGSMMSFLDVGAGEVVVLGHSYLWDAEMWRPQIDTLARRFRVIVPELWGHGRSGPMPADTKDLADLARQHLALLDRLGIQRFALAGLSIGGMWGAELALIAPGRVSALALLDTSLADEPEQSRRQYLGMLAAAEAAGHIPEPLLDAVVPLYFSPKVGERQPDLPKRFRASLAGWDIERLRESVLPLGRMVFQRRDALEDLKTLRMPALVMTGSDDVGRPPHEGQRMAEILDCPFVAIPEAGHISSLEAPDFVTAQLLGFFTGVMPRH